MSHLKDIQSRIELAYANDPEGTLELPLRDLIFLIEEIEEQKIHVLEVESYAEALEKMVEDGEFLRA